MSRIYFLREHPTSRLSRQAHRKLRVVAAKQGPEPPAASSSVPKDSSVTVSTSRQDPESVAPQSADSLEAESARQALSMYIARIYTRVVDGT